MSQKIEGISAETVEKLAAIMKAAKPERFILFGAKNSEGEVEERIEYVQTDRAKITALLASGDVVLRKDYDELKAAFQAHLDRQIATQKEIKESLAEIAKFTTKQEALTRFTDTEK